jgi:hypothetical protein
MIYLQVSWIDGTDSDYFKFNTLEECIKYIKEEGIIGFIISDIVMDIPESDYTLIAD